MSVTVPLTSRPGGACRAGLGGAHDATAPVAAQPRRTVPQESAMSEPQEIGWQVLDPDGNVVESGSVSIAALTSDAAEHLAGQE